MVFRDMKHSRLVRAFFCKLVDNVECKVEFIVVSERNILKYIVFVIFSYNELIADAFCLYELFTF